MEGFSSSPPNLVTLAPRNHRLILKKVVNPSLSFRKVDSFPKLSISTSSVSQKCPGEVVAPLTATTSMDSAIAAATSSNHLFAHGLPPLAPSLTSHQRPLEPAQVAKDDLLKIKRTEMAERPVRWEITLPCDPYLISLQNSGVRYYDQLFLEKHDTTGDMQYFIPGEIDRSPGWFFYCFLGYSWVVKNKKLPHYLRFHMMMGMLLEKALQDIWWASNLSPLIHFEGRFGIMYYWMAIGLTYICILECIGCAIDDDYAEIPLMTELC